MDKAHAPYSRFQVGSAVRLADLSVVTGNNQENAAYPSGLCAERVALFKAKSESVLDIEAIAVVARNANGEVADAFSCGGCRQVMMEYASLQQKPMRILMRDQDEQVIIVADVKALLPFHFNSSTLEK